ncbi:MAG: GatB/YqeY domain-containing protein [Bacilli bacterium]|nr:GatB/YqeY domain-containing protein [Bacilli bacterium]
MLNKLNEDLTNSLKKGDKFNLSVLRMLKSEIKNSEITKKEALTDDEIMQIIKKQVKIRKDSKNEYESYNRLDLAASLNQEIEILSKYLPEELSENEIKKIIDEIIVKENLSDIKSMGIIIKQIQTLYGTQVDMKLVSNLVKEKISNL